MEAKKLAELIQNIKLSEYKDVDEIINATKNENLTNILEDCKKFLGYCPYNEESNTYYNNGTFLLAMCVEYGWDKVMEWITYCWDATHIFTQTPVSYLWEYLFENNSYKGPDWKYEQVSKMKEED